ncbi:MAG: flagellar type III secretion system pore protein FliP [Verrucomicrobiae bacterium]
MTRTPLTSARLAAAIFCFLLAVLPASAQRAASGQRTAAAPSAPSAPVVVAPVAPTMPTMPTGAPGASASSLVNLQIGSGNERQNFSTAIQIVFVMTLLTLAPSLVMLMTSFTRIVIVLAFVRTALGVPTAPANQLLIGIALILTFFIMSPVVDRVYNEAIVPYQAGQIDSSTAMEKGTQPIKKFMLSHVRATELDFFIGLSTSGAVAPDAIPFLSVVPAFVLSELRTAFQMGFLIFIPFMVIDFLVGSVLMAMGMMMMPPTMVSMPLKLLLFVLVDGWVLVVRSLLQSFGL